MIKKLKLLFFLMFFVFSANAETVVFKSGRIIEGKIIERTSQYIKVDINGIAIKYYLGAVESINGEKIATAASEVGSQDLTSGGGSKRIKVMSESWRKHWALAEEHLANRQYEQALIEFNEILKEDSEDFEAYNGIGFVKIQLGNYEEAIVSFQKAIEINPDYAQAYDNIGFVHSFMRRFREAIPYFEKAIHLDPEFAASYINLASTYLLLGQYQEAVIYYQKAFQIDPQNADSARSLGVAYNDLGKIKEAKEYLQKAIELYKAQGDYYGVQKVENQLKSITQNSRE